ncbi:MAG: hypothetical protein LLF94_00600 [Chlamydiales bacterium]|nr:hypothetical protein [Chlamydiales bacterium]
MYPVVQGIGGFVSGLVVSPVILAISGKAAEKGMSYFPQFKPDDKQVTYAAGAIAVATALLSVVDSSPFMTGFKVATIAWTSFAGGFTGVSTILDKVKALNINLRGTQDELLKGKVAAVAAATLVGTVIGICTFASFPAYPAISCLLAGCGTHLISKLGTYHAVKDSLPEPHPEFS